MTTSAEELDHILQARAAVRTAEAAALSAANAYREARLAVKHAKERLDEALDEAKDSQRQPRIPFEEPAEPAKVEAKPACPLARSMKPRIVEQLLAWDCGERAAVIGWLKKLGCEVSEGREGEWTVRGLTGLTSGFSAATAALDLAPVLALLLAGGFWPQLYPGLLEDVDRALKKSRKNAGPRKEEQPAGPAFDPLSIPCPMCEAAAGSPCRTTKGKAKSVCLARQHPKPAPEQSPRKGWRDLTLQEAGFIDVPGAEEIPDAWPAPVSGAIAAAGVKTCGELADRLLAGDTFGLSRQDLAGVYDDIELLSEDDERPIDFEAHFEAHPGLLPLVAVTRLDQVPGLSANVLKKLAKVGVGTVGELCRWADEEGSLDGGMADGNGVGLMSALQIAGIGSRDASKAGDAVYAFLKKHGCDPRRPHTHGARVKLPDPRPVEEDAASPPVTKPVGELPLEKIDGFPANVARELAARAIRTLGDLERRVEEYRAGNPGLEVPAAIYELITATAGFTGYLATTARNAVLKHLGHSTEGLPLAGAATPAGGDFLLFTDVANFPKEAAEKLNGQGLIMLAHLVPHIERERTRGDMSPISAALRGLGLEVPLLNAAGDALVDHFGPDRFAGVPKHPEPPIDRTHVWEQRVTRDDVPNVAGQDSARMRRQIAEYRERDRFGAAAWNQWCEFDIELPDGARARVVSKPEWNGLPHLHHVEWWGDRLSPTGYWSETVEWVMGRVPLSDWCRRHAEARMKEYAREREAKVEPAGKAKKAPKKPRKEAAKC